MRCSTSSSAVRSAGSASARSRRCRNGALIIADGYSFVAQAPWISGFPGLAIVLLAVSLSLLGDGLADALRPELGRA